MFVLNRDGFPFSVGESLSPLVSMVCIHEDPHPPAAGGPQRQRSAQLWQVWENTRPPHILPFFLLEAFMEPKFLGENTVTMLTSLI